MSVLDVPMVRIVSTNIVCLESMRGFKEQVKKCLSRVMLVPAF